MRHLLGDNPAPCRCLSHPAVPRAWSPARSAHWVAAQHCWGRTGEWQGGAGLPGPRGGRLALKPPLGLLPAPGGVNCLRLPSRAARPPAPPEAAGSASPAGRSRYCRRRSHRGRPADATWSPAAQCVRVSQVRTRPGASRPLSRVALESGLSPQPKCVLPVFTHPGDSGLPPAKRSGPQGPAHSWKTP